MLYIGLQKFIKIMFKFNFFLKTKIVLIVLLITMTTKTFSQDNPEFDLISTSAGQVEMHFIGHGTLMFKLNGYVIHIDPVSSYTDYTKLPKADLILVTHEHGDHLDLKAIEQIRKTNTVLFCNENSRIKVDWAQSMKNGEERTINGILINAVPAYNIKNESAPGKPFHPKGTGNGYVLTIGDKSFYIAGDTENIPEMKDLKNIEVAFLPMNLPYTMSPEMVADAALGFNPKILYPYHFGTTNTDELIQLLKNSKIEVKIRKLN
jgi:L-ascorbate metabolism protein UlaG (beta-lactamase superfamily)